MHRYKTKRKKTIRRKKKSIFSSFYFSFFVFSSIIVLSAAGFLLFSPRFQVNELNISGNKDIATDDLKRIAEDKLKLSFSFLGMELSTESIFLSVNKGTEKLMEAFPEIESVRIKKTFPNKISLEVVEKTPFAIWCEEFEHSSCYLIDKKGSYIKDLTEDFSLIKIIEKEKIEKLDKKEALDNIGKITEKLKNNSINPISFNLFKDKMVVQNNFNYKLIFNIKEDLDWQVEKLLIVLKNDKYSQNINKLEYIDLRFGNQAILK